MTNSWSMLYDEILKMDETIDDGMRPWYSDYEFLINNSTMTDANTGSIDLIDSKTPWKYNEEEILRELLEYIRGTYNQHYSAGDDKIQTLDLIEGFVVMVKHSVDPTSSSMPLVMIRKVLPDVIS